MRDPGDAAAGNDAHAVAWLENHAFFARLRDGNEIAAIQLDCHFHSLSASDSLLNRGAADPAGNCANDGTERAGTTVANRTAGNAANRCARARADRGLGAFDVDFAHRFHHTHTHALFAARLPAAVVLASQPTGAAA